MGVPLENSLSNPLKACRDRIVKMEEIMCLHHFSLLELFCHAMYKKNDNFLGFYFIFF